MDSNKVIIGFIAFEENTAKYLPHFFESLKKQTFKDFSLIVIDNSTNENNKNSEYLKDNYSEIYYRWSGINIGFAKAYNIMIRKAVESKAEYFIMLNPDMIFEPDAIEKLINSMDEDGELGSATPKILKWDFEASKKTNFIDTCGIKIKSGLRFFDIGQGEIDKGQYDNTDILGPSGAAAIYRLTALEKIKFTSSPSPSNSAGKQDWNDQYFDELMFMYKEDADLAYRLFLEGCKSKLVKDSIFYHDRTAFCRGESNIAIALNRRNKSNKIKEWSFLNQHIIYLKFWKIQSLGNKILIIWNSLKMFIFVLLFEQYLFKQYFKLLKIRKKINYQSAC